MHLAHARYAAAGAEEGALIARHAALIDRAARRLAARTGGAVSADDLWSVGALGLLEAARRFDPAQNVRFESFAEHRIRGAMRDEMRRMDHLPRRLRARTEELGRARAQLTKDLQREPTSDEVAAALGLAVDEADGLAGLEQPVLPMTYELEGVSEERADDLVDRAQLRGRLACAVGQLPERLQLVLSLHYVEGLTYREIAQVLEVSEPRVCQLHSEAVRKVRGLLAGEDGDEGP
ncbi:sigma-70 family RNA polymerase sigma factor [Anaeromyxobacter paludicola]|uniref:RNA polymerase sigma factor FliA n=1 Tax=Anaeromyxobacter paludicola TaxID=2918171 RepID=A0ABM7X832_9BACT|nr:FliA/WhiG family RNA polymerase sigma factor [Anaeromyxobacter paludicola]BDG08001.1 RNA polymerase sigma factor FliA [Anaeromyxobacter paludicola]